MSSLPNRSFLSKVLIGRASQLEELRQYLTSTAAQRTLLVSGEAGVGKSRLVEEAKQIAAAAGYLVLQGNCFERDSALPYSAVTDLLQGSLLALPSERLAPVLQDFGPELVKLVPEIASRHPPVSPSPPLDGEQERRRLFHALSQLLIQLSRGQPLLVVIEDLHWADETTLDFFTYCCRHVSSSSSGTGRIQMLLTYRTEDAQARLLHALAELDRLRLAEEIRLDQLTRAETEVMVRGILELNRPLRRDFLEQVYRLSDGNPFFVEEVLKSLHSIAGLETGEETNLGELVIPRTVKDAVTRRTSLLTPSARRVLEIASVAGQRFDLGLLEAVHSIDTADLVGFLKELVAAQLVVEESNGRFRFRHALTREAVYSELLSTERSAYHLRLADTIESMMSDRLQDADARLVDLAHHYYLGQDWQKALNYGEQAGRRAQELFSPSACVEHLNHAIEAARRLGTDQDSSLLRVRAAAYEMLGEFKDALADLQTSLDSARGSGKIEEEWESLIALGMLWLSRDYDRAGPFLQAALDLAQQTGDRERLAHSLNRAGNWQMNVGQPLEALARHHEALAIFEELADTEGLASTLDLLGMTSYHCVNLADEITHHRRAVELFRTLGNRIGKVSSLSLLAVSSTSYDWPAPPSQESELAAAIAAGEEALADAQAMSWRAGESFASYTFAMALGCSGDYRRALTVSLEGLRTAIEIEHEQWHVASLRGIGELYLDLLYHDRARPILEEGLELARQTNCEFWIVSLSSTLARALVAANEVKQAQLVLPPFDDELPVVLTAWHAGCAHVDVALAMKDFVRVLRIAERLEATAWPDGRASRLTLKRVEALLGLKRTPDAADLIERVLRSEPPLPPPLLWRAQVLAARIEALMGRKADSARTYRAARQTIHKLAEGIEDADLKETFLRHATAHLPRTRRETEERATVRERYGGLTERECEVASLIGLGSSNREIADALVLSERTIAVHVANVLDKLRCQSRTQIATWATSNGLTNLAGATAQQVRKN